MIDFTSPEQLTNGGKRIPIDTEERFAATRAAAQSIYAASGHPWDGDAEQQLERRVLNGMDTAAIVAKTLEDRRARFNEA